MNPLVHQMTGSFLANARPYSLRERRLIMLAALAPDLDGTCMFIGDLAKYHHTVSHNVFFCAGVSLAFALYNRARRIELFALCLVSSLLQILLDVLTNHPTWPQQFLRPATGRNFTLESFLQVDNIAVIQTVWIQYPLMVLILGGAVVLWKRTGRTFLELFSPRFDKFITDFIHLALTAARCSDCDNRAFYLHRETGEPLCGEHAKINRNLTVDRIDEGSGVGSGDND
jgi:hypothetical protein